MHCPSFNGYLQTRSILMDIKPPINLQSSPVLNKPAENPLALKPGQKIDVKVIGALLKTETNAIALKMADSTITVQSSQPIKLAPGQALQLQVIKVAPTLEFVVVSSAADLKLPALPPDFRLKLATTPTDKPDSAVSLPVRQPMTAKIIGLDGSKIQLQVAIEKISSGKQPTSAESGLNKPYLIITIDRSQLQAAKPAANNPSVYPATTEIKTVTDFKVGQSVILEFSPKGTTPEYKLSPLATPGSEEKVAGFIKQFLPKHEPSPVLLNQLIKELPQLIQHRSVSEALQRIAAEILQNLPQRQQLNESTGLKQSVVNSGLFLEAQIPDLNKNPELMLDQDFKANLLKFAEALKQEIANPKNPEAQDSDLAGLKNLQQKTENNVAKIILDQLTSLPKEDSQKQVWAFDIPFVDRGQAEKVSIQIALDKENARQAGYDKWSVTITMTPPGLGTIQCNLSYHNETINTCFRSQQPQTTQLISRHLDHLKQQMEAAGLKTGIINIQDGLQFEKSAYQMAGNSLLDEKA